MSDFEKDLAALINRYSLENRTNTPDFILARFMEDCLAAYTQAYRAREKWYGRDATPSSLAPTTPPETP